MQQLNQKLWETYELQFPIEQKITYLIGQNGTGKTHVLRHLEKYFFENGEHVLYFAEDRFFSHPPKETLEALQQSSLVSFSFLLKYGIQLDQLFLEREYQQPIRRGKIQLVNFLCSILNQTKDTIVIIDEPERHLDLSTQETLVEDLLMLPHVKQVIVATHSPMIMSEREYALDINECIIK